METRVKDLSNKESLFLIWYGIRNDMLFAIDSDFKLDELEVFIRYYGDQLGLVPNLNALGSIKRIDL